MTVSVFKQGDLHDIERFAAGLSEQEVLDIYLVRKDELCQQDRDLFERSYKRGRALGKAKAVEALFTQMSLGKDGVRGAMEYLTRTATDWPAQAAQNDDGISFGGFRIKVEKE